MNISLPAPLKTWVEQQVAEKGYSTASEYVRDVLRRAQAASVAESVDAILIESLDSGPARKMKPADWERIRSKGAALARRRKNK